MVKFITKTVCMACIVALCAMSLNAQVTMKRAPSPGDIKVNPTTVSLTAAGFTASAFDNSNLRGDNSTLLYSTASTDATFGVFKTTLGEFSQPGTQVSTIALSYQAMVEVEGTVYVVTYNQNSGANTFGTLNTETGAYTQISSGSSVPDAISMTLHPTTGEVYLVQWGTSTSSPFGKINLANGAYTSLGSVPGLMYIAIDNDGICYGLDMSNNRFGTVSLTNGAFTQITTYTDNFNYIQDIVVDTETNELYHNRRLDGSGSSNWLKLDKATGAATNLGQLNGRAAESVVIYGGDGPGPDPCPAVTNVTATAQGKKVTVSWTAATGDVDKYEIYQGTKVGEVLAGTTTWTSGDMANGTYTFEVAATYDDGCVPVKVAAAAVTVQTCDDKVTNLDVAYNAECTKATITWDAPAKGRNMEMLWDNTNINAAGNGGFSTYYSSVSTGCYSADDFVADGAWIIEKITSQGWYHNTDIPVLMSVAIYDDNGGKPGNEIFRANDVPCVVQSGPNMAPVELILPTPFQLPSAGKFWLATSGIFPTNTGFNAYYHLYGSTPIGSQALLYDEGNVFNLAHLGWHSSSIPNMVSLYFSIEGTKDGEPEDPKYNVYRDGVQIAGSIEETTFEDTTFDPTQDYTWSVAVICSHGGDGEWVEKDMDACDKVDPPTCDPVTGAAVEIDEETCVATITWDEVDGATGYKVNGETVAGTTHTETVENGETYTWEIVAICGELESTPVEVTATADCKVDGIKELSSSVTIFPNPVSGTINITAKDFAKVEVYNTVGQLVETKTTASFDVSSYNTGIYFFKVYDTNNNSVTKRVMVTK